MNIISLGAGVQSSAMYFMSCEGILPRADYAIFSDTGGEKQATYEYLQYMKEWAHLFNGIPIIHSTYRNLYDDLIQGNRPNSMFVSSIPAFTENTDGTVGMLKRQCSQYYKREVVDYEIKKLLGIKTFNQFKGDTINVWLGISTDEISRMRFSVGKWKHNHYPLVGFAANRTECWKLDNPTVYNRAGCEEWLSVNGFKVPVKSGCAFCPYTSDWEEVSIQKEDWEKAIAVDEAIRNSTAAGIERPIYLNRELVPLIELKATGQLKLFAAESCTDSCFL